MLFLLLGGCSSIHTTEAFSLPSYPSVIISLRFHPRGSSMVPWTSSYGSTWYVCHIWKVFGFTYERFIDQRYGRYVSCHREWFLAAFNSCATCLPDFLAESISLPFMVRDFAITDKEYIRFGQFCWGYRVYLYLLPVYDSWRVG